MVDLFLLIVDQDCKLGRAQELVRREQEHSRLLWCLAIQEVEVWMLALHASEIDADWDEIRQECHLKERYAEAFLERKGSSGPGQGRKALMSEVNWANRKVRCPELAELESRTRDRLSQG
jgi:hypothetical protein